MQHWLPLLVGPELLWLLFFLAIQGLIHFTGSPQKRMDTFWLSLANFVPLIAIPMTFALYQFPGVEPRWLLLRIWIAGVIGAHFVLNRGLKAHSLQGPGVGTAYMVGILLTIGMLLVGSIVIGVILL